MGELEDQLKKLSDEASQMGQDDPRYDIWHAAIDENLNGLSSRGEG